MAKNARTELQRLEDLPLIEALSLKGYSQREIAERISVLRDYSLTQQQISYDLDAADDLFAQERLDTVAGITLARNKALKKSRLVQKESWNAWEQSQTDLNVRTMSTVVVGGTIKNGVMDGGVIRERHINERIEKRAGDKGFLDVIEKQQRVERELLALDAPPQETPIIVPLVGERKKVFIPANIISKEFVDILRDIEEHGHTEYLFYGGRGSTKSSFVSLAIIALLVNHPTVHGLAMRQVANTLRDSVYSQLQWAIDELKLTDDFKSTTSPIEITYKPTGQKIFFRGGDEPGKIKSIKPPFGTISLLWLEELDQYRGPDAVRKIEQSALRGSEMNWDFKSYNPPRTVNSWVNQYALVPKKNQLQSFSNYLSVPTAWLGQPWIDEAEHLRDTNPEAYKHEYGGIAIGLGGQVFDNVVLRPITDKEILGFDHIGQGIDWGWYPDPFAWGRSHYDAARMKLYIFDEFRANKKKNRAAYDYLVKEKKIDKFRNELIIADSAEPKSVDDFREYGANIRGAEKKPDSVNYSMKWLQSLVEIIIDPVRCPHHAKEFIEYELEVDKDGNYISEYPDKNNHFIDQIRYRTNMIWRVRGE